MIALIVGIVLFCWGIVTTRSWLYVPLILGGAFAITLGFSQVAL